MKNLCLFILALTISYSTFGQNDEDNAKGNFMENATFKIGGGVLIPQNNLKKYFGISPLIELSAIFPLKNKRTIEVAFQFIIPNQEADFKYIRTTDTISAKATFMWNPMLKFKKQITQHKKTNVNLNIAIGGSFINTNARNPSYEGKDNQTKYETIKALLISPGIELTHHFSNQDNLSFSFNLQYSPYKVEGALREEIGSIFYTPKLSYKF